MKKFSGRWNWHWLLDSCGHCLHFPDRIQHPICNMFDRWIGLYEDDDVD